MGRLREVEGLDGAVGPELPGEPLRGEASIFELDHRARIQDDGGLGKESAGEEGDANRIIEPKAMAGVGEGD